MTTAVLVLATHNAHKVEELRRILGDRLGGVELIGFDGPEPEEDGDTFAANALLKARHAARWTGLPAIADDSGIAVDALGGAPGIHSARYAGTRVDADNVALLLERLAGLPADARTARFVCAAAAVLLDADGKLDELVETASWEGRVLDAPTGAGGFGYDPVFAPVGGDRSAAELTPAEKDASSHRTRAFVPLVERLLPRLAR